MFTDFEQILASLADGVVIVDEAGTIVYSNAQANELLGYAPGDLVGRRVETLIPVELRDQHVEHRGAYMQAPSVRHMGGAREVQAVRTDGSLVSLDILLAVATLSEARIVVATLRDMTELRQREQDRDHARALAQAATHQSPVPTVVALAPDARIMMANAAAARLLGITARTMGEPGTFTADAWDVLDGAGQVVPLADRPLYQALLHGRESKNIRCSIRRKVDGATIAVEISAAPVRDPAGHIVAGIVMFTDVTTPLP